MCLHIEQTLTQFDGVIAAHVNYATERATVLYDAQRISAATLVNAVQKIGFDVPLKRITLFVDPLLYASSARTLERALGKLAGVVCVSVDLVAEQIDVDVLAEHASLQEIENALVRLGLHPVQSSPANAARNFKLCALASTALAIAAVLSASAYLGFWTANAIHSLLAVMVLALVILFSVARHFFMLALKAGMQGKWDASVLMAFSALALALGSLILGLFTRTWLSDLGLVASTVLIAGWFLARVIGLWVLPRMRQIVLGDKRLTTSAQSQLGVISNARDR